MQNLFKIYICLFQLLFLFFKNMEKYLIVYMSMELDDITLVLKELDDVAAKQRSIIFEKSRLSGKVPRDWKKGK